MAKKDKKAAKPDPKEEKAAEREFEFGVEDIAEELGIKPASVRVQLRNKGIEKAGKSYGWNSKKELKEVIAQIKSKDSDDEDEDEKPAKKAKGKASKDEAPAKGKKGAKPAKSSKKSKKDEDEDEDDDD